MVNVRWPLGIDIGYSQRKKSLALAATSDVFTPYRARSLDIDQSLFVSTMTLADAVAWAKRLPAELKNGVLALLDGPIGAEGRPVIQRYVDAQGQVGQCQLRCPPASVVGGGAELVAATYSIMDALAGTSPALPHFDGLLPRSEGPIVAETNPTLGMAWMLPSIQDTGTIPSRKNLVTSGGRTFKAKSDFYWAKGASALVGHALGSSACATLVHHEHEAGLYCLAVAKAILGASATVCTIGKTSGADGGVFHLLGPIHPSWDAERRRIGLVTPAEQ